MKHGSISSSGSCDPNYRRPAFLSLKTPFGSRWISLLAVLLIGVFGFTSIETAHAKRVSKRDLREFGYKGLYKGTTNGQVNIWNGSIYVPTNVFQPHRQKIPLVKSSIIAAPTGTNGFFLNFGNPRGSERRIKLVGLYSGFSFNSFYSLDMKGSGSRIITIRKKGKKRPRFVMTVVDGFQERDLSNALYTYWGLTSNSKKK